MTWPQLMAAPLWLAMGLSIACEKNKDGATVETPLPGTTKAAAPSVGEGSGLTAEDRALVEEAVRDDPRVREITGDRAYSITNISPWYGGGEKFAGVAHLFWDEPIRVTYEWPTASYRNHYEHYGPKLGLRPYRESVSEFTVYGLTGLEVSVDLQEQRVIGIEPSPLESGYERIERPEEFVLRLSAEEREQALAIFGADERVQAILASRDYSTQPVVGASFGDTRLAGVIAQWDDREDIEADWPLLIDLDAETGEYRVHTALFTAETVGRLDTLIDLDKQQVITIEPSVGD